MSHDVTRKNGKNELTLVGEPMMVGSGDFCSHSDVRGEEPRSLVGEEPRLAGRPSCGQ